MRVNTMLQHVGLFHDCPDKEVTMTALRAGGEGAAGAQSHPLCDVASLEVDLGDLGGCSDPKAVLQTSPATATVIANKVYLLGSPGREKLQRVDGSAGAGVETTQT